MSVNESPFPKLRSEGYSCTSPPDEGYNCIAWAAGVSDQWWDPASDYPWPDGIPRDDNIGTLVQVFETLGYVKCETTDLEPGIEKIAIYGDKNTYEHAARQLSNGYWTSKLGFADDIEHKTLAALVSDFYGSVQVVMKRQSL